MHYRHLKYYTALLGIGCYSQTSWEQRLNKWKYLSWEERSSMPPDLFCSFTPIFCSLSFKELFIHAQIFPLSFSVHWKGLGKGLLQRHRAVNEISLIYLFVDAFSQLQDTFKERLPFTPFKIECVYLILYSYSFIFLPHEDTEFTDLKSPWPFLEPFLKFIFIFSNLQLSGTKVYFRPI